jgi:hypothetical protein
MHHRRSVKYSLALGVGPGVEEKVSQAGMSGGPVRKWRYAVAAAVLAGAGTAGTGTAAAQAAPGPPVISSGTFRSVTYLKNVISPRVALPAAVATGHITSSGRDDLVVTTVDRDNTAGGTTVAVYRRLANGKLGAPVTVKTRDANDVTTQVIIADLYRNGHREILLPEVSHVDVFSYGGGHLRVSRIPVPASDLVVADFNGDGHPDLLITTTQQDTTQVWTGSASHAFRLWRTVRFPEAGSDGTSVFAADFDHNGRPDIALFTPLGFVVRSQTGQGTFGRENFYGNAAINGQLFPAESMAVGDVTSDGYPDVITDSMANRPWSGVEVFVNARNGTFKDPVLYPVLDIPTAMTVADLTGDGRNDLVVEHACWRNIGVLPQRAAKTLAREALYPAQTCDHGPDQPAVGDLNGDGKPDIAVPAGDMGIAILYAR